MATMNSEPCYQSVIYRDRDPLETRDTMGKETNATELNALTTVERRNLASCLVAVLTELPAVSGAFDAGLRDRFGSLATGLNAEGVL